MNPHQLVGLVGPANNFAMNGLVMHFARILIADGHTLPPPSVHGCINWKIPNPTRVHQDTTCGPLPNCQY